MVNIRLKHTDVSYMDKDRYEKKTQSKDIGKRKM